MKKKKTSAKTIFEPKTPKFSLEALDRALSMAEEYMERAMVPFVLLGETLKTIMEKDQVDGEKIEIGMLKRNLTKEVLSLFKEWKFEEDKNKFKYEVEGVPVEIMVISRIYPFFENSDLRFYKITNFKIPNPWKAYWDIRGLIK